ncbi:MAG: hypothetical protein M1818_000884 [Claussenomyces sp. TS43310]|nr:MAG: hypothetical protein M1818_000884 [Claussenomyces sp. TS43310]
MFAKGQHYQRIEDEELSKGMPQERKNSCRFLRLLIILNIALALALALAFLGIFLKFSSLSACLNASGTFQSLYSPVEEASQYETTVFSNSLYREPTVYQYPTSEADAAWEDLYKWIGLSKITPAEAAKLPDNTSRALVDSENYVMTLDVVHQLHCLNRLRKLIWPERYHLLEDFTDETRPDGLEHLANPSSVDALET